MRLKAVTIPAERAYSTGQMFAASELNAVRRRNIRSICAAYWKCCTSGRTSLHLCSPGSFFAPPSRGPPLVTGIFKIPEACLTPSHLVDPSGLCPRRRSPRTAMYVKLSHCLMERWIHHIDQALLLLHSRLRWHCSITRLLKITTLTDAD